MVTKKEAFTIGIFGSNGKTSTASMLVNIFNSAGLHVGIINDKKGITDDKKLANIRRYKQLKVSGINDIIIIEVGETFLKDESLLDIEFDILIHCRISEDSFENSPEGQNLINGMLKSCSNIRTTILNTDDPCWKKVISDMGDTYLITYGLGSKATVTASSIECGKQIQFCYCLQRSLTSFTYASIEPMEIPIVVNAFGQYNVYSSLAAITTALIYGVSANIIVSSLCSGNIPDTSLKVLYENEFCIIDCICDDYLSFETGFEAAQYFPYDNIFLVQDLSFDKPVEVVNKTIELITAWSIILKIRKVYYLRANFSASDDQYLSILRDNLCTLGTSVYTQDKNVTNVEGIINSLEEKDMLLFFCSRESDFLRERIMEILDKRILGNLTEDAD